MKKRSYLTTVAAIALLAGAGVASAQRVDTPASKNEAPSPAPQMQKQAPAEKMDKGAQQKPTGTKSETTGQAQPKSDTPKSSAQPKSDAPKSSDTAQQPAGAQKTPSTVQQPSPQTAPTTGQATAPAAAGVTLTTEQRTQVRSSVLTASAPRLTTAPNFALSVGTVVPTSVRLVAVPDVLIRIHPAWRGHQYFVVNDEIIIVDARTHKIVAVLVV